MNRKECPSCAMMVDRSEDICPICQYEFGVTHGSRVKYILIALLFLVIFVVVFMIQ